MKTKAPDSENVADAERQSPTLSFSHLALLANTDDGSEVTVPTNQGFPSADEERLYETGYLMGIFLRC
jgi:hypothetical protein